MQDRRAANVRNFPVSRKAMFRVILLTVGLLRVHAAEIQDGDTGVVLAAPASWQESFGEKEVSLVPPDDRQSTQSRRRIHLAIPASPAGTLEEEMSAEMDRIEARWGPGTSNSRQKFLGAVGVRTKSGIGGIRASFGDITTSGKNYGIIKYYFRHRDGSIFKVCVHVYGDQSLADEYDAIIMNGLRYDR